MFKPAWHRLTKTGVAIATAGLLALVAADEGWAMGKMVLFSAVQGKVLLQGKAVAGAVIEREAAWTWKDEVKRDAVSTDAAGEFKLPPIIGQSLLGSFLPHEPVVRQSIVIKHDGRTYEAWVHNKHNYDDNGELAGKPIKLTCRLETAPARHGKVFGICDIE